MVYAVNLKTVFEAFGECLCNQWQVERLFVRCRDVLHASGSSSRSSRASWTAFLRHWHTFEFALLKSTFFLCYQLVLDLFLFLHSKLFARSLRDSHVRQLELRTFIHIPPNNRYSCDDVSWENLARIFHTMHRHAFNLRQFGDSTLEQLSTRERKKNSISMNRKNYASAQGLADTIKSLPEKFFDTRCERQQN